MYIYIKYIIKVFLIFVLEIRHSMGEIDCKMLIIENIGSCLNEIFRIQEIMIYQRILISTVLFYDKLDYMHAFFASLISYICKSYK